jgi:hypothetical protein
MTAVIVWFAAVLTVLVAGVAYLDRHRGIDIERIDAEAMKAHQALRNAIGDSDAGAWR